MKKIVLVFLVVVFFSCKKEADELNETSSISGLELTYLELSGNYNLRAIYFIDNINGFACGYDGKIIMTSNEGISWSEVESHTSVPLFGIDFINNQVGFAVGGESSCGGSGCMPIGAVLLKTIDKGVTWNQIPLNLDEKIELKYILFINDSVGFSVGGSTILRTNDSGKTWQQTKFENLGGTMQKIVFNENIGMIICLGGKIITTNNSGENWSVNSTVPIQGSVSISLTKKNEVFISGNSKIFKSNDLGNSWTELKSSPTDNFDINFTSQNVGFAVGRGNWSGGDWGYNYGSIFYTLDGGENWIGSKEIKETTSFHESSFPSQNKGYIVSSGAIVKVEIK